MPRAFIVDFFIDGNGRRRVGAIIQWGGTESLNPRDVGMKYIHSINLSPQIIRTTNQPLPIGSVRAILGSPGPQGRVHAGFGSTVTLRWVMGSTGTRIAVAQNIGTLSTGTKTAHAWVLGV